MGRIIYGLGSSLGTSVAATMALHMAEMANKGARLPLPDIQVDVPPAPKTEVVGETRQQRRARERAEAKYEDRTLKVAKRLKRKIDKTTKAMVKELKEKKHG